MRFTHAHTHTPTHSHSHTTPGFDVDEVKGQAESGEEEETLFILVKEDKDPVEKS